MKKSVWFLMFFVLLTLSINAQTYNSNTQISLYVCEKFSPDSGPIGQSIVFTKGSLTVVATADFNMNFGKVFVQLDRMGSDGNFYLYKKFRYDWPGNYPIVYFYYTSEKDLSFDEPGYYRIFLLNYDNSVLAYTSITIVD